MSTIEEDPGPPKSIQREKATASGTARLAAGIILLLCFAYLLYSNSQFKKDMSSEIARIDERIKTLEDNCSLAEASLSGQILGLREDIDEMRDSLLK
jgi:hypothetical protein